MFSVHIHARPTLSENCCDSECNCSKNDAPVWTTPSSISISENPASGDLVWGWASDEDVSAGLQSLTYSINSGKCTHRACDAGINVGKLTVLDPAYFDYEGVLECISGVAPRSHGHMFIRAEPSMTKLTCTQACSLMSSCVGFMRATAALDSVSAECFCSQHTHLWHRTACSRRVVKQMRKVEVVVEPWSSCVR